MESQPNNIPVTGPGQTRANSTETNVPPPPATIVSLPVSTLAAPLDALLRSGVLTGASRPGQLARLGRFEILKLIGAGGVGLVFLARDPANGSLVAVKLLRPEYRANPVAIQRFESEARHMQQLRHPGILAASDLAASEGHPYFVMPWMERGSLADRLKTPPPLRTDEILRLTREMAEALAYAHARGIIHRDLKPANVLLSTENKACLTDFGLARTVFNDALVDPEKRHGEGTAPYMSPGVAAGRAEDTRCDVYSLGAVLYEMLAGHPPYSGHNPAHVVPAILKGPPVPILKLNPAADRRLAQIAEGAMGRELRNRYPEINDLIKDLDRAAAGNEPIGPFANEMPGQRQSIARRRSAAIWAGSLALLLIVPGVMMLRRSAADRSPLEVIQQVSLPGLWSWKGVKLRRLADKTEPLIVSASGNQLVCSTIAGGLFYSGLPLGPAVEGLEVSLVRDLEADSSEEVIVHWESGRRVGLSLLNHNFIEQRRFVVDGLPQDDAFWQRGRSHVWAQTVVDFDGDDRRELLAIINTPWTPAVRAVLCFDFESGHLLWQYATGPTPHDVQTLDLDGDGRLDVVFGSASVDNGHVGPDGTDDSRTYLTALNSEGQRFWQTPLGGRYTFAHTAVADLDNDQSAELLAWMECGHEFLEPHGEVASVIQLNSRGDVVKKHDFGARIYSCVFADLDGDEIKEVLATDRLGQLHVLDANFTPKAKVQIMDPKNLEVRLYVTHVIDLGGSTAPEICLTGYRKEYLAGNSIGLPDDPVPIDRYHDFTLFVLDTDLRLRGRHMRNSEQEHSPPIWVEVADIDADQRPEILWADTDLLVLRYQP